MFRIGEKMNYLEKLKLMLVIVLLPTVSYGLLGPLEIYFGNEKDFNFFYTDFVWCFIGLSIIAWLIVSAILALFPEKLATLIGTIVLGLGVASYVQNMFMNVKLSEADGGPMRWEELGNFPMINLIIWVMVLLVVILGVRLFKDHGRTFAMTIAGFLSAIQIIAIISLVLTSPLSPDDLDLQMSGENQFSVASDENIIVFVLDTVGNTNLERMLEIYPDALDDFKDFTYYNNADCHYYCTFPSMTHFLTGEEFNFESKSQDWMKNAWSSERAVNFWNELDKIDYSCNLFSAEPGYVYGDLTNLEGKFDNIKPMETTVNKPKLVKLLGKMSIYRYVPYILKPRFEVLTNEFNDVVECKEGFSIIEANGKFYNNLSQMGLRVEPDLKNALMIQHLFGAHKPYTIDSNVNIVEESTIEETLKGLTVILAEYLRQLDELGKYDDATIIITADHGAWYGEDTQPIFFIKRSNETHEKMKINEAPISLDDFQATILDIVGKEHTEYGTSIYDWKAGDSRERTVYMRMVDDEYPEVEGSMFNVYYKYSYFTDKAELNNKVAEGPEEILPATPW